MGYSSRYHAASLAAVFLALAIGIVIGAGLGDNLLSNTEQNLRASLEGDIEDARGQADELRSALDRERAFSSQAYPALVADSLSGRSVGVLAFGELPGDVSSDVEDALAPTGAELAQVAVVRLPPDVAALADELGPRFAGIEDGEGELRDLGRRLGEQFVDGQGRQLDRLRDTLFLRSSGEGGRLDAVVLVGAPPAGGEPSSDADSKALESGMIEGVADTGAPTVAVERNGIEESTIPFYGSFDVASVDSVDLTTGEVALVFALLGAEGSFGVKPTANSLLPELLEPSGQGARGG